MDYGLLSGLAKGLDAGMDAYEKAKDRQLRIDKIKHEREVKGLLYQQQKEKAERDSKLDLYKAGARYGDSGEVEPDTENPNYGAQQSRQMYQDALSASVFGKEALEKSKLEQSSKFKEMELGLAQQKLEQDRLLKEAQIGKLKRQGTGGAGAGKRLTPAMIEQQSSAKYINDSVLGPLSEELSNNSDVVGPAQGLIGKAAGFVGVGERAEKQRILQSRIDAGVQEIGKFLEGGKLAEGDLARYREMGPKVTDPPNVIQAKLKNLSRMVSEKQRVNLEALKGSGYDTSGIGSANQIKSTKSGLLSREEKLKRLKELEGN